MSVTYWPKRAQPFFWSWDEAFDKFGFGDGDGLIMTGVVANALRRAGFVVIAEPWGCHNVTITSISRNGTELIPEDTKPGYDDPRDYLPKEIVELLDNTFPEVGEVPL